MFSGKSWTLALCVLIYVNRASAGVSSESSGSSSSGSTSTADRNGCTVTTQTATTGKVILSAPPGAVFPTGTSINLACAEGYAFVGGANTFTVTCSASSGSTTGINWDNAVPQCVPEDSCEASKAEVGFVLDHSGSMDAAEFDKATKFAADVVLKLKIDAGAVQVGLIKYSNSPATVVYGLGVKTTHAAFVAGLPTGAGSGGTDTADAIDKCNDMVTSGPNVRPGVPKFCIVVTDGESSNAAATALAAANARGNGITMLAIGVAGADTGELEDIASTVNGNSLWWYVTELDEVVDAVAETICD